VKFVTFSTIAVSVCKSTIYGDAAKVLKTLDLAGRSNFLDCVHFFGLQKTESEKRDFSEFPVSPTPGDFSEFPLSTEFPARSVSLWKFPLQPTHGVAEPMRIGAGWPEPPPLAGTD